MFLSVVGVAVSAVPHIISASLASITKGKSSGMTWSKNDNTQYSFTGRSYDVGAPAGPTETTISLIRVTSYRYTEFGYMMTVVCVKYSSSDRHLEPVQPGNTSYRIPNIHYAIGMFPNAGTDSGQGRHVATITAGAQYSSLQQPQFEVVYTTRSFSLHVSQTSKLNKFSR